MMGRLLTATAATLLLFTAPADADTKSWTALKNKIPANANVVVSVDVTQLAKTSTYQTAIQTFLDQEQDAKMGFELFKTSCGVDVTTVVTDVTVMGLLDVKGQDERALIAVGLNGVDKAKLQTCMQALADLDKKGAKLTAKTKGKITEFSVEGETKKLYVAWLAKDVIAFTTEPEDKAILTKMIAGKAAKGDLKKFIAKTTSTSAAFFSVAKADVIPDIGNFKGVYGNIDLASGSINLKANVVVDTADAATKLATVATQEIKKASTEVQKQMPDFAKAIGASTATANGTEVTISGSITEKVLLSIIPQLDKIL
jgi:hypothetical protein